jgi:hypothetical protein
MTCHPAAREPTVRGVIYLFNYLFREARIHAGVALPVGELPMHGCPDFSRASVLARAEYVAAAAGHRMDIAIDAASLLTRRAGLLG